MKVSSTAAENAANSNSNSNSNGNGNQQNSPALAQLRAAIETDGQAGDGQATAVLEAGEEAEQEPGPSPSELFDLDKIHEEMGEEAEEEVKEEAEEAKAPEGKEEPEDMGKMFYTIDSPIAPAPYVDDPITDVKKEIEETSERIVSASIKISELDAELKATKKSWKTASDELVALHLRKMDLLLDQQAKAERAAAAVTVTVPIATVTPATTPTPATPDAPTTPDAPESTATFHARIDAAFATFPAIPDTPEQEAWDRTFRATHLDALDGVTPKILEILAANQILTVGDWQDVPSRRGIEYTQLSGGGAKLTETRFEKVMAAMLDYMAKNPRPDSVVDPAPPVTTMDIDDI